MTQSYLKRYSELQTTNNKHVIGVLYSKYPIIFLCLWMTLPSFSQVGVGTKHPHPSAELEVKSSVRGFLLPRLTPTERNAINSPAAGLQVYDTSSNSIWYFNGTIWVELGANLQPSHKVSSINLEDHFFYLTPKEDVEKLVTGLIRFDGSCFMLYDGNSWVQLNISPHTQ